MNAIATIIEECQVLINDAKETQDETGNPLVSKIVTEMQRSFRSDPPCEFSAIKMKESISTWHSSIQDCF